MSTLYELTDDFLKAQEMLLDEEFDKEAVKNTLESIEIEIEIKADNYAKVIKNLKVIQAGIKGQKDALKNAMKDEIDKFDIKEKNLENKIKYLKEKLSQAMKDTNKEKIKTELFSFYFKKNQSANIIDEKMALESEFVRVKKEIDKDNLLKAMKSGETFDFAEIKESESLIIR